MKFLNFLTATVLGVIINVQAFGLPMNISQQVSQVNQIAHATVTSQNISRNWSGYAATNGTFTGVTGSWKIPDSSTNSTYGIDATWVGIGGVNTNDLIQAGTQTAVDGNGYKTYEAFIEMLPDASRPVNLIVNAGDSIIASVVKNKSDMWDISIKDVTSGKKVQRLVHYTSSLSSVEWVEEAPSSDKDILPLDNFGTIAFTDTYAIEDGKKTSLMQTGAQPMHMGNSVGQVLATTSLVGEDGKSFSVRRTNAAALVQASSFNLHIRGFDKMPFVLKGL